MSSTTVSSQPPDQRLGKRLDAVVLGLSERIWNRLPARAHDLPLMRSCGVRLHSLVRRRASREMYTGTLFLRNRPALELMRRIAERKSERSTLRIAVLGCSIGAEVYSILWTLRHVRPDVQVVLNAVDISPAVLAFAEEGVYSTDAPEVNAEIFDCLTDEERREMFDWDGNRGRVKPSLRQGITWRVGDASDPDLITALGPHDIVVASNFLCHMNAPDAERCLRNLAQLAGPGGYLFVSGVDLDVRTRVALDLAWHPVSELRAEMHEGDPLVRADWPWQWWGLEPLDRKRADWETRYASAFMIDADAQRDVSVR